MVLEGEISLDEKIELYIMAYLSNNSIAAYFSVDDQKRINRLPSFITRILVDVGTSLLDATNQRMYSRIMLFDVEYLT